MQFKRYVVAGLLCLPSPVSAESSFPRHAGPHTYPGDVPEGCDVIDATVRLEKWRSYEGPFIDLDVPFDPFCLTSTVYHPIIHVDVNLMCAEGERSVEWRFQGGGDSGQPIQEMGNEIPSHKLRSLTPIHMKGFPKTIDGASFREFLGVYNEHIRGGKLGTYAYNPDDYGCGKQLNCGGYFLITLKEMMRGHIIEESTDELADELKKDLGDCEHFAWELAGDPEQYDNALDPLAGAGSANQCDEDDFTSGFDGNCYKGPDGKCYEDPTTTACNGVTQSHNENAPCYFPPSPTPQPEVTPLSCAGAAQSTNPHGACFVEPAVQAEATLIPAQCAGAAQSSDPAAPCYIDPPGVTTTPTTPPICNGMTQTTNPGAPCYVAPGEVIPGASSPKYCAGRSQSTNPSGSCYVPPIATPAATIAPPACNGMTQMHNPRGACYLAPISPPAAAPTPQLCLGKGQSTNPKGPCYLAPNAA